MYSAGLDRSGTPDLLGTDARHDPYVTCVAAIPSDLLEDWRAALHQLRLHYAIGLREELHGHELPEEIQRALIETAISHGLRIGVLSVSKAATRQARGIADLPSGTEFQFETSRMLLERFLPFCPVRGLWCDEDIRGKERQKAFTTEVKRIQRVVRPDLSLKVRHRPSESTELIQLADVIAYGFACEARGSLKTVGLKRLLEELRTDPRHLVLGPIIWGE